ncbi:MAG TPA: hypothetical protein VFI08_06670 [Spirochaetia bacterium]|nr:hypothetical protein [Spirochaetia bacterium]
MSPLSRRFRLRCAAAACAALFALAGCQRKGIEELVSSELFSLSMGKLEDQVDLFQFDAAMVERPTTIAMRDGWFYIANGGASKIMVFSSYGDLLFLLYNPQTNPAPTILGPADTSGPAMPAGSGAPTAAATGAATPADPTIASTRGYEAYPFTDIGRIAVASDRTLYVEDAVPEAKEVKDADHGVIRSRVILRFDRRGRALPPLGEEGIGGSPFPYVSGLHVTARDQLVVVCRLPKSWEIFWFSSDGVPLYQVEVSSSNLPSKPVAGVTPVLVNVLPDPVAPLLYLVINSYREAAETRSAGPPPSDAVSSRVYRLDLRTQQYAPGRVELPANPPHRTKEGLKTTEIPSPPGDLLGVSRAGNFYVLDYTDTNLYTLQIVDPTGRVRAQRRVVIEDSELSFEDIHLSSTGIIYGLLADKSRARVAWWRSDLLLKGD